MERFQRHLETIPVGMILMLGMGAIFLALIMPKRFGFYLSIFLFPALLNCDRFYALPWLASGAKVTFWLPPVMLLFFSSFLPDQRRPVPGLAWLYLLCPILGVFCTSSATDSVVGMLQFFIMFIYAVAGITVYRFVTTNEKLMKVALALFLGLLVPVGICFSALVIFRGSAFRVGNYRFEPFGMLSNQYAHILASACCLGGFFFMTSKKKWFKFLCICVIAACGAMIISSGSRQGLIIIVIAMLPTIRWGMKNPLILSLGVAFAMMVGVWVFAFTEGASDTSRLTDFSHTSGRYENQKDYLYLLLTRPMGLFGTTGESVHKDFEATHITHNSYLRMAYLGGMVLVLPLFVVGAKTVFSTITVIRKRKEFPFNEALLLSLAALMFAIYLQGIVNDMIYSSVSSWCFLHYFLSCMFMGLAKEAQSAVPAQAQYAYFPQTLPAR